MDPVIAINNKAEISNYGSKLVLVANGPGLRDVLLATNRNSRGKKPQAHLVLLKPDGSVEKAKRTKLYWRPWLIEAEFEFPSGVKIAQKSWVEWPFVHSTVTIKGDLGEAKLAADGESYHAAKALVSPHKTVLVEDIDPALKPFALELAASVKPDRILLSTNGKEWSEADFAWAEDILRHRMIWDRAPREMTLSARASKLGEFLAEPEWRRSRLRGDDVENAWRRAYRDSLPDLECPENKYRDLLQYCFYVHLGGVVDSDGMLPYDYVMPSKLTYPAWWLWDTAFHSIADAWMADPSIAFGDLLNHTIAQTKKGCIPDAGGEVLFDTGQGRWLPPDIYDNFPPPSTGPCVNGLATWDVYQKTGNLDFLKRMYPHLVIYERWLLKEKGTELDPDLIQYENWYDVGWDDSKRWGKTGIKDVDGYEAPWDLPVVPVDGNVFLSMLRDTLSKAAALIGYQELSKEYADKAARTRRAVQTHMWNDEVRFYFDVLPDGKMLDVWTPAGFTPLLVELPCPDRYAMMREHLLNPEKFWAKCPLPTLALDDEHFSVKNWWRGGTWPVINWQVNEGVFRYDPETGMKLLEKTVDMMTHTASPTCREHYSPKDGEGGGAIDQGWGTMPVDLILRRMMGLNPMPDHLMLDPHLPANWNEARVRNVFAAGTRVEVAYQRVGGKLTAVVTNTGTRQIEVRTESGRVTVAPGKQEAIVV